ncbi:MoaD/ThiS family protein [Fulvivirga lutimaris]|uniref:MoaD/ThiS family protein n=1 Tax=Fulvivirga lutimaris TaxID=1819566 RepID=UPI0012BCDA9F|nr:MoaD/ThiS family protein [Fulvivirga lutimaris]MTI38183.1 MoaD/ThiS family protein [Fulvivirga lutimaris]
MKLNVLLFGVTKDIIGGTTTSVTLEDSSVLGLKSKLFDDYPKLKGLNSLLIAVNNEYADDDLIIKSSDEVAIIPPVSGG